MGEDGCKADDTRPAPRASILSGSWNCVILRFNLDGSARDLASYLSVHVRAGRYSLKIARICRGVNELDKASFTQLFPTVFGTWYKIPWYTSGTYHSVFLVVRYLPQR